MVRTAVGAAGMPTLDLMQVHINTLFCLDSAGRLRCVNEIGEPPAPLLHMGRTRAGNLCHFRHDLPASLVEELEILCRAEPVVEDFRRPPQNGPAMKQAIRKVFPSQSLHEYRGPAYWIPPQAQAHPAHVTLIAAADSDLLQATFPWLIPLLDHPEIGPVAAAIEQGRAVSLCFCARRPALATEAGVETLPEFRGKGYATATVAAWAAAVMRRGCMPLYSTSWENLVSQAVARRLGMGLYGEDWSIQ